MLEDELPNVMVLFAVETLTGAPPDALTMPVVKLPMFWAKDTKAPGKRQVTVSSLGLMAWNDVFPEKLVELPLAMPRAPLDS